jgi:hypothetical protein
VIDGDWRRVKMAAGWFRFGDEDAEVQERYGPLWVRFVEIAETEALLAEHRARSDGTAPS